MNHIVRLTVSCAAVLSLICSGCASSSSETPADALPSASVSVTTVTTTLTAPTSPPQVGDVSADAAWEDEDTQTTVDDSVVHIALVDNATAVDGDGVTVSGNVITIVQGGQYRLSGTLTDGQIRVESPDENNVQLLFDGLNVHSETTAPLFIKDAEKVIVTLVNGSENTLSDSTSFAFEDTVEEEPSAAFFSKADVTINGSGTLTVDAVFRDGIVSRDGLKIADGTIVVNAADDALMGRDYVLVGGGRLTLNADGDGIKSTNDASDTVGFVMIENGTLAIQSGADGIQAQSTLTIGGGTVDIVSGGGSFTAPLHIDNGFDRWDTTTEDSSSSGKGLKADGVLTVAGGTVTIDAYDDAVHSNYGVVISGGNVTAAAGDDGIHADRELLIADGVLTVTKSYEGLEAGVITIDGGTVSVTASDDGINASNGTLSGSMNPMASDGASFVINGGTLYVDAQGDGLDSNGTIVMTGGMVSVVGPENSGNGTFDYATSFAITGGTIVAVGSSGMAQTPSHCSMNSIVWGGFSAANGDTFVVKDAAGNKVVSLAVTRSVSWAYVASPSLTAQATYTVSCGSSAETVTLNAGTNTIGSFGGMGGMGGEMGGRPGGMGGRPGRPF